MEERIDTDIGKAEECDENVKEGLTKIEQRKR